MKVLVAEDNLFTANQYNKILEKNGHEVTMTRDGTECIEKYQEGHSEFDVVLLDNNMPIKNGAEVAQTILEKEPEQRIIFASAYDIDSLLRVPKNLKKCVEVLQKPFSLNKLLCTVEKKS